MTQDDRYDYDYHNLAEDVYFIDEDPVVDTKDVRPENWENYYHSITEELIED